MFAGDDDFDMDDKFWEDQLQEEILQPAKLVSGVKRKSFDLNPVDFNISKRTDPLNLNSLLHKKQKSVKKNNENLTVKSRTDMDDNSDLNDNLLYSALDSVTENNVTEKHKVSECSSKELNTLCIEKEIITDNQLVQVLGEKEILLKEKHPDSRHVTDRTEHLVKNKDKAEVLSDLQFSPSSLDGDIDLSLNVSPSWKPSVFPVNSTCSSLTSKKTPPDTLGKGAVVVFNNPPETLDSCVPYVNVKNRSEQGNHEERGKMPSTFSNKAADKPLVSYTSNTNVETRSSKAEMFDIGTRIESSNQSRQLRNVPVNVKLPTCSQKLSVESVTNSVERIGSIQSKPYTEAQTYSVSSCNISNFRASEALGEGDIIGQYNPAICAEKDHQLTGSRSQNEELKTSSRDMCFNKTPNIVNRDHVSYSDSLHNVNTPASMVSEPYFGTEEFRTPSRNVPVMNTPQVVSNTVIGTEFAAEDFKTPSREGCAKETLQMVKQGAASRSSSLQNMGTPASSRVSGGKRKRKFPGPAGVLPKLRGGTDLAALSSVKPASPAVSFKKEELKDSDDLLACSQSCEDRFQEDQWLAMKANLEPRAEGISSKYCLAEVVKLASKKQLPRGKVPVVCAVIEQISTLSADASVLLRDTSGVMKGTIHRQLVKDHPSQLVTGTVLVLRQCGVFSPTPRSHYLNITTNNLVRVYSRDPTDGQTCVHKLSRFLPEDFVIPKPASATSIPRTVSSTSISASPPTQRPLFGGIRTNSPMYAAPSPNLRPQYPNAASLRSHSPRYRFNTPNNPGSTLAPKSTNNEGINRYQMHNIGSMHVNNNSFNSVSGSLVGFNSRMSSSSNRFQRPAQNFISERQGFVQPSGNCPTSMVRTRPPGGSNTTFNRSIQSQANTSPLPLTNVNNVRTATPDTKRKSFNFKKASPPDTKDVSPVSHHLVKAQDHGKSDKPTSLDFSLHDDNLDDLLTGMEDELLSDM